MKIPDVEINRLSHEPRLQFSQDGRTIWLMSDGTNLDSWNALTGQRNGVVKLEKVADESSGTERLVLSSDARRVAMIGQSFVPSDAPNFVGRLKVWDVATGKLIHTRVVHFGSWMPSWSWMPDDKTILIRTEDGFLVMDVATGATRTQIKAPNAYGLVPSPDGRLLADQQFLTETNSHLTIFETVTGKELTTLPIGVPALRRQIQWIGDRTIISITNDTIDFWDLQRRRVRSRIPLTYEARGNVEKVRVMYAALLPDGRRLFTSLFDGSALLWDLSPELISAPKTTEQITEAQAATLWADLASDNPGRAYQAIWRFIDSPASVHLLIKRLMEAADTDYEKSLGLIAKLGDAHFLERDKAQDELRAMGIRALQAIRDAQRKHESPEILRRLESLASRWPAHEIPARTLARLRAIAVLEKVNSKECRQVLTDLAMKSASKTEANEAQAALDRLGAPK